MVSLPAWCPFGIHTLDNSTKPCPRIPWIWDLLPKCYPNHAFNIIWKVEDWTKTTSKSVFYCSAPSCVPFVPPSCHNSLLLLFFKWKIFFLHAGAISSGKEAMLPLTVQTENEREGREGCSIWLARRQHAVVKQVGVFILTKSFLGGFPLTSVGWGP